MIDQRVFRGLAIAPLPVLAVMVAIDPLAAAAAIPLAYGGELLIGLPVHVLLTMLKRNGLGAYLGTTALAIVAPVLTLTAITDIFHEPGNPHALTWESLRETYVRPVIAVVGCACVTATLFWWIAVRQKRG